MVSYATNAPEWDCLTKDIVSKNGKLVTSDETVNRKLRNGHIVYCMDNGDTYKYDEENGTLLPQ